MYTCIIGHYTFIVCLHFARKSRTSIPLKDIVQEPVAAKALAVMPPPPPPAVRGKGCGGAVVSGDGGGGGGGGGYPLWSYKGGKAAQKGLLGKQDEYGGEYVEGGYMYGGQLFPSDT